MSHTPTRPRLRATLTVAGIVAALTLLPLSSALAQDGGDGSEPTDDGTPIDEPTQIEGEPSDDGTMTTMDGDADGDGDEDTIEIGGTCEPVEDPDGRPDGGDGGDESTSGGSTDGEGTDGGISDEDEATSGDVGTDDGGGVDGDSSGGDDGGSATSTGDGTDGGDGGEGGGEPSGTSSTTGETEPDPGTADEGTTGGVSTGTTGADGGEDGDGGGQDGDSGSTTGDEPPVDDGGGDGSDDGGSGSTTGAEPSDPCVLVYLPDEPDTGVAGAGGGGTTTGGGEDEGAPAEVERDVEPVLEDGDDGAEAAPSQGLPATGPEDASGALTFLALASLASGALLLRGARQLEPIVRNS